MSMAYGLLGELWPNSVDDMGGR